MYIGHTLRAYPAAWLPVASNLALLDTAMKELLSTHDVWVPELRSMVAQFIHFGLLRRSVLLCLNAIFKFMQHEWGERRLWWPIAWRELQVARWLLPLLVADIGCSVAPIVVASDASGPAKGCPCGAYALDFAAPPLPEIELGRGSPHCISQYRRD